MNSTTGYQHYQRRSSARTIGGFIASGFIDESEAVATLEQAVRDSGAKNVSQSDEDYFRRDQKRQAVGFVPGKLER